MSIEVIKKARIAENSLPPINSITEGYEVRYRIISEDKNRISHWSPIFLVQPEFSYISGSLHHTHSGDVSTVIWTPVQIKKGTFLIKEENIYDVWVRWDKNNNGDYRYNSRVQGTSINLLRPTTYYIDGVDQEELPNRLSVEIYLKGSPVSRSTNFLRVYQGGPFTV